MSDSRPPIYDDGGGLPDVERRLQRDQRDESAALDVKIRHHDRGPNYLVRRALAVGAGVLVVAGIAVGVGRLLGGGDDTSSGGIGSADWNTVVAIDTNVGTVVLSDAEGEETGRFRLGVQPILDSAVVDGAVIGVSADAMAVAELGSDVQPADIATVQIESTGELLRPSGTAQTLIAHDAALRRLVMVHAATREVLDTDLVDTVPGARYDLALARSDAAGRNVLVTDAGNFQSVLFSFDREQPSFFPGLALAVDDAFVVTAQNVGSNANVSVFDHEGESAASAQTPTVRAGMIGDGTAILVTVDGQILAMSLSNGEVTEIGSLAVGTVQSGHVAIRGDRLIVTGTDGTAVIGPDGAVIADLPAARPTTSGIDELAPRRAACLIVEREVAGEIVVVDLEDGTILAEALANPEVLSGASGCEPIVPTSAGYLALTADGVLNATVVGDVIAVSPDGRTIAAENANRLELLPRLESEPEPDDDPIAPIDIGRAGRVVTFADL
jgi:hypothetical protein